MRPATLLLFILIVPVLLLAEVDSVTSLESELSVLEAELSSMLKDEVTLADRETYVKKVLDLRDRIEALEASPEAIAVAAGTDNRTYTLVKVEGAEYPGEDYRFDPGTMTFSYLRENSKTEGLYGHSVKTAVSMGLEQYPETIVLGEDFSFVASIRSQRDVGAHRCSTTSSNKYGFTEKQELRVGAKKLSAYKTHTFIRPGCEKSSSNGNVNSSQSFGVGHSLRVGMNCRFAGTEKAVYLEYKYKCEPGGIDGELEDDFYFNSQDAVELSWSVEEGENGKWVTQTDFANRHELTVTVGGSTIPSNAITLLYQADYKGELDPQEGGTVQHTVAVNNTWQDLVETRTRLADSGPTEESDSVTPVNVSESGSSSLSDDLVSGRSTGNDRPGIENRPREELYRLVDEWIARAEPVDNARPGYSLKFDPYARVFGKAGIGYITLLPSPEGADAMKPQEYALSVNGKTDSLNLCTLAEYVKRRAAGQEIDSCMKEGGNSGHGAKQPSGADNALPNFVGASAATVKSDLRRLNLNGNWKAGTSAPNGSLAGTVEKQAPAAGSKLESGAQVTLWVYRAPVSAAGKKVFTVPAIVGLTISQAEQKIRAAGFTPKKGKEEPAYERKLAGTVKMQYPKEGTQSSNPGEVLYNVYGELQIAVPYLHGKGKEEALKILRDAGLRGSVKTGMTTAVGFGDNVGKVYETNPSSGTRVASNSLVNITVWGNMAPAPKLKPKPKLKPRFPQPPQRVIPEKIPPQQVQRQDHVNSAYVNPNIPSRFNCETGLNFMPQDLKKGLFDSEAGQGGLDWTYRKKGLANYDCNHNVHVGRGSKRRSVVVYWYVRKPQPGTSDYKQYRRYCAESKRDGYGNGRAISIFMNVNGGIKNFIGEQNARRVFDLHSRQVWQYAVPCE